jgi:2'-5' RNA ligase
MEWFGQEPMRAFIALDVPTPQFGGDPAVTRQGAGAHLTFRFFADLDAARVPEVVTAIDRTAAESTSFRLTLEGVGAFPNADSPRVVWVGVGEGRDATVAMAAQVDARLAAVGLPPEPRGFSPHITLFRVRGARDRERARLLLRDPPSGRFGETVVRELLLKESVLTPSGAVHRVLHRGLLGAGE